MKKAGVLPNMVMIFGQMNDLDRFHLVADVIERVPQLGPKAAYAKQAIRAGSIGMARMPALDADAGNLEDARREWQSQFARWLLVSQHHVDGFQLLLLRHRDSRLDAVEIHGS